MYKDKDKQREAVKAATRRYRGKNGDSALPGSKRGLENARGLPVVDEVSDTQPMIPSCDTPDVIPERTAQGNIRVSKPGDSDYEPRKKALPDSEPKTAEEAHRVLPPDTPYPGSHA